MLGLLLCLVISKRQDEVSAERQRQLDLNSELREEATASKDHSQLHGTNDQGSGNEGNYADLTDRSLNDQQYSCLHMYAKAKC